MRNLAPALATLKSTTFAVGILLGATLVSTLGACSSPADVTQSAGDGGTTDATSGDANGAPDGGAVDATTGDAIGQAGDSAADGADGPTDSAADAPQGCIIGGQAYASGAVNPTNPCQSCQPATSTTMWTNLGDGTGCGNGEVCAGGQCGTQCDIQGTIYASGQSNPANLCEVCQPGSSTTGWTNLADGSPCSGDGGSGNICHAGSCGGGCEIGGTYYTSGQLNPANACQSCQPGTSQTTWSPLPDGTGCAAGEVCQTASCVAGCFIGMTFYAPNAANPANACQSCQPATTTVMWSNVASGATCDDGNPCTYTDVCNGAGLCAGTAYTCIPTGSPMCVTSICDGTGGCTTTIHTGNQCSQCSTCNSAGACISQCGPSQVCSCGGICIAPGNPCP